MEKSIGPPEKRLNDAKLTFQSMQHQRRKNIFFLEHSISVEVNPKRKPRKTVTAVSRSVAHSRGPVANRDLSKIVTVPSMLFFHFDGNLLDIEREVPY